MSDKISSHSDITAEIGSAYDDYDVKVSQIITDSSEMLDSCDGLISDIKLQISNIQADRATVTQYKADLWQSAYDDSRSGEDIRYGTDGHDTSTWDQFKGVLTAYNPDWTARNYANDIVQGVPFDDELAYLDTRESQANALLGEVEAFKIDVDHLNSWAKGIVPNLARLYDFNMGYVATYFKLSALKSTLIDYVAGMHGLDDTTALNVASIDDRVKADTEGLAAYATDHHYEKDEDGNYVNAFNFETNQNVDREDKQLFGGNIEDIVGPTVNTVEELVAMRNAVLSGEYSMYGGGMIDVIDPKLLALGFVASTNDNQETVLTAVNA